MTAFEIVELLRKKNWHLVTAESCTGGMLAAAVTDIAGSSDVFDCGFVTYSNAAKTEMLGVPVALIELHGAVSEQVARQMAKGALLHSNADVAIAITGVAGPGGGTPEKPVGLVHFASATRHKVHAVECRFGELTRQEIRRVSVEQALKMLLQACG